MVDLRENPMKEINGQRVVCIEDYQSSKGRDFINDEEFGINIPKSNVLIYYLEDGSKICARPSGTEPKIKFYVSVKDSIASEQDFREKLVVLEQKIKQVKADLKL